MKLRSIIVRQLRELFQSENIPYLILAVLAVLSLISRMILMLP